MIITHSHSDHLSESLLKEIQAAHPDVSIYGSADITALLTEKGLHAIDHALTGFEVGDVKIEVLAAGHDAVLGPVPENSAYRINGELLITGDSTAVSLDQWQGTRLLALVTIAPWGARPRLAALIDRLGPKTVFPVHDGFVKDDFLVWQDATYRTYAEARDVQYLVLGSELTEL